MTSESTSSTSLSYFASESLCQFCVLATFHADHGPVLEHSVPVHTGLDEHMLAEQMIPDGLHKRDGDWTLLIRRVSELSLPHVPERPAHVVTKSPHTEATDAGDCIYILSSARTIHTADARRGAKLFALAVGTMHPHVSLLKPVLVLALDAYVTNPSPSILVQLHESLNSLPISTLSCVSYSEKVRMRSDPILHAMYHSSGNSTRMDASSLSFSKQGAPCTSLTSVATHMQLYSALSASDVTLPTMRESRRHSSASTSSMHSRRSFVRSRYLISEPQHMCGPNHYYITSISFGHVCIPISIPLYLFPEEVGEYSLSRLFSTFGFVKPTSSHGLQHKQHHHSLLLQHHHHQQLLLLHPHLHSNGVYTHPVTLLFNALITHKRVLFVAYHSPATVVVEHVLAACALVSGCGAVLRGFVASSMPYVTLASLDTLRSMRGFIAGTTHPRIEELGCWDVLCDCESGQITVSAATPAPPPFLPFDAQNNRHAKRTLRSMMRSMPEWTLGDERADAPDVLFMHQLMEAVKQHASESFLRHWCQLYVRQFVALSMRHEQAFYGVTLCHMLPDLRLTSQTARDMYSLRCHALRIEAWRMTPSYRCFLRDIANMNGHYKRISATFCLSPCSSRADATPSDGA